MKPSALLEELAAAYASEGQLFEIQCDLLYQCDLDCAHCYLDEKATRNKDTAFWLDVIDQAAAMKVASVTMSGGEAFLRKDLLSLVARARSHGMLVALKSHGGHITSQIAAELASLGVSEVQISYYSPDPDVHDAITRRPGSHGATLRGIQLLVDHGVPTTVACCAMGPNVADIDGLVRQCEELGVPVTLELRVHDAMGGSTYPREMALSVRRTEELATRFEMNSGYCRGKPDTTWAQKRVCSAGHLLLYINPEGLVTPCPTWPQALGDLSQGDRLKDIWSSSSLLHRMRGYRNQDRAGCQDCESTSTCSYCPGQAYVEHGDPMRPATAVCNDAYARASAVATAQGHPRPASPPGLSNKRFQVLTTQQVERASQEITLP